MTINSISTMSNQDIYKNAAVYANKKAEEKPAGKIEKMLFPTAVGAYIAADALKQAGPLSAKVKAAGRQGIFWAILGASFALLNKGVNEVAKNNKTVRDFKNNQQVPYFITSLIALFGMTTLALAGLAKGKTKLAKMLPEQASKISEKVAKYSNKLDTSSAGKLTETIKSKYQDFAKDKKALNFLSENSTLAIFLGWLAASIGLNSKINQDKEAIFKERVTDLATARSNAQTFLLH